MRINYEPQLFEKDGQWYWTVTITRSDSNSVWTSAPAVLEGAVTYDEAVTLARPQLVALRVALGAELEASDA